jgi:glycine cleavage system H protein
MALERFTKDHEYIRVDGDIATVGITSHAQVPEPGRKVKADEAVAVVESVKAASDVFSPVSGEVLEGNVALPEQPALVNEDAEGKAWFFKLRLANKAELDGLMDRAAYEAFVKENG